MRSRVLFLDHVGAIGGAELALLDVARAYRDTSSVVLFADGPFRNRLASQGIEVQVLQGSRALHAVRRETRVPSLGAVRGLASLVQRLVPIARQYDCLHANTQKAFVTACVTGLLARRPVIWDLHDLLATDRFSRAHIRLDVTLANHCAVRVIANSHASAAAFIEGGGRPDLVRVVHNGIAAGPFDAVTDDEIAETRRDLNVGDAPLVGVFSRLGDGKGQDVAVDALTHVPGAHLLLVGDALFGEAGHEAALRERAARLGLAERVHFLGFRSDVPRLMRTVDIVALTSSAPEPFGRVVVEGMLASRPVVATGVGGVPEIVTDGTGVLVPPGDPRALASALCQLLADPVSAGEIARKGRVRAATHFTVEAMVDRKAAHIEAAIRKQAAAA